ncbi:MAG: hypothetical protein LUH05_09685 [Candidatus Gastranaerophilales bacterium]|nr:hypothetical protein [Candidatus Gastranaerophilales bacterium]
MRKSESINYEDLRKEVSNLFINVLTKKLSIREALASFPKDCEDKTIIASWHALCHLEADEELRQKDSLYKKEQDEYIEFIAFTLQKGEALPQNITDSYLPYYNDTLISESNTIKGIIHKLKKFLCC